MSECYDRTGKKISMAEWTKLNADKKYVVIKKTYLKNGLMVSTVWLGINHNFNLTGLPIIFETKIFSNTEKFTDWDTMRSSTEKEAIKNHKEMILKAKKITNSRIVLEEL